MGLWQKTDSGQLIPRLSPMQDEEQSPDRLLEFCLAGTFIALHTLIMRYPVTCFSPHVLLLLFCKSCPPDFDYLRASDPNAATILSPWFAYVNNTNSSKPVSASTVRHILAEYLSEPVSDVRSSVTTIH
jgi:hypothetical protein